MIVPHAPQLRLMLKYVGMPLLLMAAYDAAVVVAYKVLHWEWIATPHIPLALYGSAIGVVLAFRNTSAYARWWEGRTLWGAIVNNSRNWGRHVTTGMRAGDERELADLEEMRRRMVYHQIAYVHALRQHLRGLEPWWELKALLAEAELQGLRTQKNVPLALLQEMGGLQRVCLERGWLEVFEWRSMDTCLAALTDAQGGTERLKNTPLPKQYDYFPKLFMQVYCLLLPLTMVTNLGWATPLGSTAVGFIFLALDKIGRDLEDPFDNTEYDVPMTSMAKTVEVNLRQMLGETELPELERPVGGVLW